MNLSPEFLARFDAELMKRAPGVAQQLAATARERGSSVRAVVEAAVAVTAKQAVDAVEDIFCKHDWDADEGPSGPEQVDAVHAAWECLRAVEAIGREASTGETLDGPGGNHVVTWPGKTQP